MNSTPNRPIVPPVLVNTPIAPLLCCSHRQLSSASSTSSIRPTFCSEFWTADTARPTPNYALKLACQLSTTRTSSAPPTPAKPAWKAALTAGDSVKVASMLFCEAPVAGAEGRSPDMVVDCSVKKRTKPCSRLSQIGLFELNEQELVG